MTTITTLDQQIRARARSESDKEIDNVLNDVIRRFSNEPYKHIAFATTDNGTHISLIKDETGAVKSVNITIERIVRALKVHYKKEYGDKCEQRAVDEFVKQVDNLLSRLEDHG